MTTIDTRCVLAVNSSNWAPLDVLSIGDAITNVYLGKSKIIDETYTFYTFNAWIKRWSHPEDIVHARKVGRFVVGTPNFSIVAPQVVIVHSTHYSRKHPPQPTPENVAKRDEDRCQYCGRKFKRAKLSRDHIFPESRGGKMDWDNVVAACLHCNGKKRDRTPAEAGMVVLRKPFVPQWHWLTEHLEKAPPLWRMVLKMK